MKRLFLLPLLLLPAIAFAQGELSAGLLSNYATHRPAGIDVVSSIGGTFGYGRSFQVKNSWTVFAQVQFSASTYIMDGLFKEDSTGSRFDVTPDDYKQSSLTMYSFKLPVLMRYCMLSTDKGAAFFAVGPYIDYVFSAKQKYKVGSENHLENAPIDNRFNYGLSAEMTISKGSKRRMSLSYGLSYQLSEFLSNRTSFKPLSPYLRIGIGI
jgi:hypothetical protein